MEKSYTDVSSVTKTYQRLRDDGIQVSICTLRRWIRQGALPAAFAGRKALIYYPNVLKLLHEGTEHSTGPASHLQ